MSLVIILCEAMLMILFLLNDMYYSFQQDLNQLLPVHFPMNIS